MSPNQDRRYLTYITVSIELIEQRISGKSYDAFLTDVEIQDAILWRLETIGEATGKLSDQLKARHPHIRWRAIYGFRNIAAHDYLELNLDLVWEIITLHLSDLKETAVGELRLLDRPDAAE